MVLLMDIGHTHMIQPFHLQSKMTMEIKKDKTAESPAESGIHMNHIARQSREKISRQISFPFQAARHQPDRIMRAPGLALLRKQEKGKQHEPCNKQESSVCHNNCIEYVPKKQTTKVSKSEKRPCSR